MEQKCLDITKIKTVKELNSIDFSKYVDKQSSPWVKYVKSPVPSKALDAICNLSTKEGSMVTLGWSMGDLFYKELFLPQTRPLKQMTLPTM